MANRSMQLKVERARLQSINAGMIENMKPAYITNDKQDAAYRVTMPTFDASKITLCKPGKAYGLDRDFGNYGKRGATRETKNKNFGRVRGASDDYVMPLQGLKLDSFCTEEKWELYRPV